MNVYQLADEVEMWGRDLLACNMKGGVPCIEGARMLRQLQDDLSDLQRHIPVKELTDEEIIACIDESEPDTTDMIRFARAILRKAQNK
jgi:hypothetical protein